MPTPGAGVEAGNGRVHCLISGFWRVMGIGLRLGVCGVGSASGRIGGRSWRRLARFVSAGEAFCFDNRHSLGSCYRLLVRLCSTRCCCLKKARDSNARHSSEGGSTGLSADGLLKDLRTSGVPSLETNVIKDELMSERVRQMFYHFRSAIPRDEVGRLEKYHWEQCNE